MKVFNSFQAVVLFALWPFIVQWLRGAEFAGHTAAFWAAIAAYIAGFVAMVVAVRVAIDSD